MKNQIERKIFRVMAYAFLPTAFTLLFSACQTNSTDTEIVNNLIGTWSQSTRTIAGTPSTKDSTRFIFQINSNNICVLCDSSAAAVKAKTIVKRSGWSYNAGLFNLAVDMPASWIVTPSLSSLIMERSDFNSDGTISKTVLTFKRVADIDIK